MPEFDSTQFVMEAEKIVKLLETMARRGIENPIPQKNEWDYNSIQVSAEESKEIKLFALNYRNILCKTGKNLIEHYDGTKGYTKATQGKMLDLALNTTSESYCITVIEEIEEAVMLVIKEVIS